MKLTEHKTKDYHYFEDEERRYQGVYKSWYGNGQQSVICHFRDDELHGEYRQWGLSGELRHHTFDIDGEEIIDFLENPDQYPTTPEEKLMFVLKYGNVQFIRESEDE